MWNCTGFHVPPASSLAGVRPATCFASGVIMGRGFAAQEGGATPEQPAQAGIVAKAGYFRRSFSRQLK
ncbi:MAG TPA: hypothetical protein VKQ36_13315 [Ktedonobacterales bacterium]|nr:hypothetical protein [Ktedonobacterales bacterium]